MRCCCGRYALPGPGLAAADVGLQTLTTTGVPLAAFAQSLSSIQASVTLFWVTPQLPGLEGTAELRFCALVRFKPSLWPCVAQKVILAKENKGCVIPAPD